VGTLETCPTLDAKKLLFEAASRLLQFSRTPFRPADDVAGATPVAVAQRHALPERSLQSSQRFPPLITYYRPDPYVKLLPESPGQAASVDAGFRFGDNWACTVWRTTASERF